MDELTAQPPGPLVSIWPIRAALLFSSVELLEVPIDPPLAERDAPLRGEIGGSARARRAPPVQRDEARHLLLEPLHPLREGVAHPFHDLEQREIDVTEPAAEHVASPASCQHALEIAQNLRP